MSLPYRPVPAAGGDPARQAEYLAGQLRKDPVYLSNQVPREIPRSAAPQFAEAAGRTGMPTYVILLPDTGAFGERLLATVHDRLRKDGLYVLLDATGIGISAAAFGVDAPTEDAARTVTGRLAWRPGSSGPGEKASWDQRCGAPERRCGDAGMLVNGHCQCLWLWCTGEAGGAGEAAAVA